MKLKSASYPVLKAASATREVLERAEAAASRMRNRSAPADLTPDEAYKARLKARITLPKVKGYWE